MFGKNTIDNHQLTCFPGTYLPRDTDNIETWLLDSFNNFVSISSSFDLFSWDIFTKGH